MTTRHTRREFIGITAAGSLAAARPSAASAQAPATRDVPPNERIQIATLGVGIQGIGDTRTALRVPGVELSPSPTSTTAA